MKRRVKSKMAQKVSVCQFCERSRKIKWKCINCDLALCENCKIRQHSKFAGSEKHSIIKLNEVGTLEEAEIICQLNLDNIKCLNHQHEKCFLFCQDCSKPVCLNCVLEVDHQGHKLNKLKEIYTDQLKVLKTLKSNIEIELSKSSENINKMDTAMDNYNDIKQQIQKREAELKEKVSDEAKILISELHTLVLPNDNSIIKERQKLQTDTEDLKNRKSEIEKTFKSHNAMDILETPDKVKKDLPSIDSNLLQIKDQHFYGLHNDSKINFGNISIRNPILNFIEMVNIRNENIDNIKTMKNGDYVAYKLGNYWDYEKENRDKRLRNLYNDRHVYLWKYFTFKDSKCMLREEKTVKSNSKILDFTITEQDQILLCLEDEQISSWSGDKITQFFSIEPRKPFRIHAYSNESFIVAYVENNRLIPNLSKYSGIIIVDTKGNIQKELKSDNETKIPDANLNKKSPRVTFKITTNTTGDKITIDKSGFYKEASRILVLGPNFEFRWTYEGNKNINSNRSFDPVDVVTTPSGMVIITDQNSHTLHVLSTKGTLLTSINKEQGICRPHCLNIDNNKNLQVICMSDFTFDKYGFLEEYNIPKLLVFHISE